MQRNRVDIFSPLSTMHERNSTDRQTDSGRLLVSIASIPIGEIAVSDVAKKLDKIRLFKL